MKLKGITDKIGEFLIPIAKKIADQAVSGVGFTIGTVTAKKTLEFFTKEIPEEKKD